MRAKAREHLKHQIFWQLLLEDENRCLELGFSREAGPSSAPLAEEHAEPWASGSARVIEANVGQVSGLSHARHHLR